MLSTYGILIRDRRSVVQLSNVGAEPRRSHCHRRRRLQRGVGPLNTALP